MRARIQTLFAEKGVMRTDTGNRGCREYHEAFVDVPYPWRAVTALEYGLIAALVAVVAVGGFQVLGNNPSSTMNSVAQSL